MVLFSHVQKVFPQLRKDQLPKLVVIGYDSCPYSMACREIINSSPSFRNSHEFITIPRSMGLKYKKELNYTGTFPLVFVRQGLGPEMKFLEGGSEGLMNHHHQNQTSGAEEKHSEEKKKVSTKKEKKKKELASKSILVVEDVYEVDTDDDDDDENSEDSDGDDDDDSEEDDDDDDDDDDDENDEFASKSYHLPKKSNSPTKKHLAIKLGASDFIHKKDKYVLTYRGKKLVLKKPKQTRSEYKKRHHNKLHDKESRVYWTVKLLL